MTNKHIELPAFSDPLVQIVYAIVCDQVMPPNPREHWEGYAARRIVAAIAAHEQARVVGEPVAWAATSEDGKVEALGFNQSRRFDTPLVFASPPAPQEAQADLDAHRANGLAWAVSKWKSEVQNRPLINKNRRPLDDAWRQVVRYFGGDPVKLLGHAHDELLDFEARGMLASPYYAAPVAQPATEQAEAPSDADPLTPEQEEWVMDLAERHNLGRRVPQIGAMRGVAPDVFYTDASYRTHELFCFAAGLLSTKEQS